MPHRRPALPGDSLEQQIAAHLTLDPPKPRACAPLSAGFDEVIAPGMAKNPDKRYQSARELAAAARQALTSAPALKPVPSLDATRPAPVDAG